jgi:3-methylcrotonyl-CoA carboxylase alpha subunit
VAFLHRIADSVAFRRAELDTGLIERHRAELFPEKSAAATDLLAAAAYAELADEERSARERAERSGDPYSPWHRVDGWRLNEDSHHDFVFLDGEHEHPVRVHFAESGLRLALNGTTHAFAGETVADGALTIQLDGRKFRARAVRDGEHWHVFTGGDYRRLALKRALRSEDEEVRSGSLGAPMPGKVIRVMSRPGDAVKKGQPLLILEAMKMEHTITAPMDGIVKAVHFAAGEQVLEGSELISIE